MGYILSFSDWKLLALEIIFVRLYKLEFKRFILCWQNKNRHVNAALKIIFNLHATFPMTYSAGSVEFK